MMDQTNGDPACSACGYVGQPKRGESTGWPLCPECRHSMRDPVSPKAVQRIRKDSNQNLEHVLQREAVIRADRDANRTLYERECLTSSHFRDRLKQAEEKLAKLTEDYTMATNAAEAACARMEVYRKRADKAEEELKKNMVQK